jgi:hypothetical protein
MSGPGDYEVGYGKPPVDTRFGGPRSNRPSRGRVSRNLKSDLLDELGERIEVKANGRQVKLSQQRALLKALAVRGIKGDVRAIAKLLDLALKVLGPEHGAAPVVDLTAEDQAILDRFVETSGGSDA